MGQCQRIGMSLIVVAVVAWATSPLVAAPIDMHRTNRGADRPFSQLRDDKPTFWDLYIRPTLTDPAWDRGWQFPEDSYGNWVEQIQGQILEAGTVRSLGYFVVYDLLAWELVPHLLYLDTIDAALIGPDQFDPERIYQPLISGLGFVEREFVSVLGPSPEPIPSPSSASVMMLGLAAMICIGFRRPTSRRAC